MPRIDPNEEIRNSDQPDEEVGRLMEDYGLDEEVAESVQELIDEGLDEDEAVEIAEEL